MPTRRQLLKSAFTCVISSGAYEAAASTDCYPAKKSPAPLAVSPTLVHPAHIKTIPSSGERITSIGMGTWITFDVSQNEMIRNQRSEVLQAFFDLGGQMLDSSPMYGYAEEVLGYCLGKTDRDCSLFSASKIWTPATFDGVAQMANSEKLWGVEPMDLMYVHNLLNWKNHLPQLTEWKAAGRVRYIGVTTSHGRRHHQLEEIIKTQKLDFVQLTYNYDKRQAEHRLIPLARDNGVAVVVNRPFERGDLITKYQMSALPPPAIEMGCSSWAQYLLMFAASHPDVTVVIPATSKLNHMEENMAVLQLALPEKEDRSAYF